MRARVLARRRHIRGGADDRAMLDNEFAGDDGLQCKLAALRRIVGQGETVSVERRSLAKRLQCDGTRIGRVDLQCPRRWRYFLQRMSTRLPSRSKENGLSASVLNAARIAARSSCVSIERPQNAPS